MTEERFVVARSDWHAKEVLKKAYKGRIEPESLDKVFMKNIKHARERIKQMRLGVQEEYSVYRVHFDRSKVAFGTEASPYTAQ